MFTWSSPGFTVKLAYWVILVITHAQLLPQTLMNNRNWNILCRNIRGLNAVEKHDAVRNKIEDSGCSVICLQETKM
jgi:hypothetical protein